MTPSPSERAPELNWRMLAGATAVMVLAVLGGLEGYFRSLGFQPSVSDTVALFATHLSVAQSAPTTVALVGTSRFQVGIDPAQIEAEVANHKVANLSLIGQSAVPVLEHLAHNTEFSGVAVFEFMPIRVYTPDAEDVVEAVDYLKRADAVAAYSGVETWLRIRLQSHLVLLNPEIRLEGFLRELASGKTPKPHQEFRANRFAPRDYAGQDVSRGFEKRQRIWRERVTNEGLSGVTFAPRMAKLRAAAEAIRKRGGDVLFYRINSSGKTRQLEEELFPRGEFWDTFAADCPGTCVHFEDLGSSARVELPEGSHADRRDTAKVTAGLIEGLRKSAVLKGRAK